MTDYYDFGIEYFELPFTTDSVDEGNHDETVEYTLVYVRKCTKGYMCFSNSHKVFYYTNAKEMKHLILALEIYIKDKTKCIEIFYTLSKSGRPRFGVREDENKGFWIADITGYSFMEPNWNKGTISEASNPFLMPGAMGEALDARTHTHNAGTSKSKSK